MRNPFRRPATEPASPDPDIPEGGRVLPLSLKGDYETIPLHVYHPTPHDAITVLRSRKDPHAWLAAGWYLGLHRKHGRLEGLVYRPVTAPADRELVLAEVRKRDKEAVLRFELAEPSTDANR